jgi:arginine decarboxylase
LIPAPKHVIVDRLEDGTITTRLFSEEQKSAPMLDILGYQQSSEPVAAKKETPAKAKLASV